MRLDIKTGYICNNNCKFCVVADMKKLPNRTFQEIKIDLEESHKKCEEVILTGGEVTIRNDFFEIVSYAKNLGYKVHIQSNGRMFSSKEFSKKTIQAGADAFTISIHGYSPQQHEFLTESKGSFKQTINGLHTLKNYGATIFTNTVITKTNYEDIPNILIMLRKLGINNNLFSFIHPLGNGFKNFNLVVPKKKEVAPYILKAFAINEELSGTIFIEAIPPCMLEGNIDKIADLKTENTIIKWSKCICTENFLDARKQDKRKFTTCSSCIYDKVCEGVWKEYAQIYEGSEFKAILK